MAFYETNNEYLSNIMLITDTGRSWSYREVCHLQDQMLSRLPPRSIVLMLCRNDAECIAAYLGILRKNSVPLLLDEDSDPEALENLIRIYHPNAIFTPVKRAGEFIGLGRDAELSASRMWESSCHVLLKLQDTPVPVHPDLGLLLSTSGSTGSPKLVRLSYHNLESNAQSIAAYLNISDRERPVTNLPMEYTYGLSVINSHVACGATLLVTDRTLFDLKFWEFIRQEHASSLAGVPYTYKILKRLRLQDMDLPSLHTLTQAGGRLMPDDQRFYAKWTARKGIHFYVMYGQTEATARISYLPWEWCAQKIGSIGIPVPGGHLELIDSDGHPVQEARKEGNLVYYGANVSMGYATSAEDLLKGDENHGRLVTGDLALKDKEGFFYITGRKKRFLKVFGKRVSLDMLEQMLNTRWKNYECVCTGRDDCVTVFVEAAEDPGLCEQIQRFLSQKTGIHISAFHIRCMKQIPRNPSGKIQYKRLKELADSNTTAGRSHM